MGRRTRRRRSPSTLAVLLALLAPVALVGCGGASDGSQQSYSALSDLDDLRAERVTRIVKCLDDSGFPGATEILPDNTTKTEVPEAQLEAYQAAADECHARECPACGKPLERARLEELYRLQNEAAECLAGNGIQTSDIPALQTFLDGRPDTWSPHRDAARVIASHPESERIRDECPDPLDYVWFLPADRGDGR